MGLGRANLMSIIANERKESLTIHKGKVNNRF